MRILITSGRAPGSLEFARILNLSGHQVYIAESFPIHLCLFSTAVKKNFRVPAPKQKSAAYIKKLKEIIRQEKIELLIPIYEETFYIALFLDELKELCQVFCSDINQLHRLHHKYQFIDYCNSLGIKTPITFQVEKQEDLKQVPLQPEESVIKPVYSRYGEEAIIAPKDFKQIKFKHKNPMVIQQKINGLQYSSYAIAIGGKLRALAIYPTILTYNKVSIMFTSTQHTQIKEWVTNFITQTHFTGQISFDFILTQSDVYAIECNPRLTSGIHLFAENKQLGDLFKQSTPCIEPAENTKRMLGLMVLFYGGSLIKRFQVLKSSKDVIFSWRDPIPSIMQLLSFFLFILLSMQKKITLSQATTYDSEWNGEKP